MELGYLLLGWLLGLLSPRIVDSIKANYTRRELIRAIQSEAADLQIRISILSFQLAQRSGVVDLDYLFWLKPQLKRYKGTESIAAAERIVETLLNASEDEFVALLEPLKSKVGVRSSLKSYSASLLEANLVNIHSFPMKFQLCIYEFRSHLSILNQEIGRAVESLRMTFDSTLSPENQCILNADLDAKYLAIQGMAVRVSDRLQAIIEYGTKRNQA